MTTSDDCPGVAVVKNVCLARAGAIPVTIHDWSPAFGDGHPSSQLDATLELESLKLVHASESAMLTATGMPSPAATTTDASVLFLDTNTNVGHALHDSLASLAPLYFSSCMPPPTVLLYDTFITIAPAAGALLGVPTLGLVPHGGPGWLAPTEGESAVAELRGPMAWLRARSPAANVLLPLELFRRGTKTVESGFVCSLMCFGGVTARERYCGAPTVAPLISPVGSAKFTVDDTSLIARGGEIERRPR